MKPSKVMLADDHSLFMEALCKLLEPQFKVVGVAADGRGLLETAPGLNPDIVILDIAMPILNGIEAGRQLRKIMPAVKLIYLTMNEDPELAAEAFRLGASGYLLKTSAATELFQAIRAALDGMSYVSPRIAQALDEAFIRTGSQIKKRERLLTPRQREVVQLLAEGKSMKEAAYILGVTQRTVGFHKYQVMEELGLKSSASLVQFAIQNRILVG